MLGKQEQKRQNLQASIPSIGVAQRGSLKILHSEDSERQTLLIGPALSPEGQASTDHGVQQGYVGVHLRFCSFTLPETSLQ